MQKTGMVAIITALIVAELVAIIPYDSPIK